LKTWGGTAANAQPRQSVQVWGGDQ
jgi:hypothetical protein